MVSDENNEILKRGVEGIIALLSQNFKEDPEIAFYAAELMYYRLGFWLQEHDLRSKL